jgi:predicted nucleic acid-binding Zn ribbon protein
MITAPAIQFKGAGWYVTDYASKGAAGADACAEKPSGEKSDKSEKSDGAGKQSSAKEAKDSSEKKSVKKK